MIRFPTDIGLYLLKAHRVDTTWDIGNMLYDRIKIDTSDIDKKDRLFYFVTTNDTKAIVILNSEEHKLDPPFLDSPIDESDVIQFSFFYKRHED